jgi:hypothetical protein
MQEFDKSSSQVVFNVAAYVTSVTRDSAPAARISFASTSSSAFLNHPPPELRVSAPYTLFDGQTVPRMRDPSLQLYTNSKQIPMNDKTSSQGDARV